MISTAICEVSPYPEQKSHGFVQNVARRFDDSKLTVRVRQYCASRCTAWSVSGWKRDRTASYTNGSGAAQLFHSA